ncbi:glycoside hydrolase family 3 protein [Arthrobacter sp. C152]
MTHLKLATTPDGIQYRDLNGNGIMDPFEDPRRTPEERTEDLLTRLSLDEKIGLMFQTVIESGPAGSLLEKAGHISKSPTSVVVLAKNMNHFNVHGLDDAREAARWSNALQDLAARSPHGIPVTISTDPRHAFAENVGVGFSAGPFSQWPEGLGLAAIDDAETTRHFAEIASAEYTAVGIRSALHPQVDLATEPRWGRQLQTFGSRLDRVIAHTAAYLEGFQGATLGPGSVSCTTKHFPGGGPQKDGEDAHFPYGREQVYPGGRFEDHLAPFRTAIEHDTAAIMPYYGMPLGIEINGQPVEEVGFGYNRQIIQELLREELGFNGVIVTDWELVNDNVIGDQVLPARAWGVEHLDARGRMLKILEAGADQFGGEECVEILRDLVDEGLVAESRIDASARRLLLVKFRLGLFDNPFVDEDTAGRVVGCPEHRAAGDLAQSRSVCVLENKLHGTEATLPVAPGQRLYIEGIDPAIAGALGTIVPTPDEADLAIIRIAAPFDARDDLFLESFFHQGGLEFRPGLIYRLNAIASRIPLIVDVALDRGAILTPISTVASALTASFGVSDSALLRVLSGEVAPVGRLPIALPKAMDDVWTVAPDTGLAADKCLYPAGHRALL